MTWSITIPMYEHMYIHVYMIIYMYVYIYIYTLWAPGFRKGWGGVGHVNVMYILTLMVRLWVGVGWGGACQRHVYLTLMVRSWVGVGWSGACQRHVHLTWWYVHGLGWGGVGHVNVMYISRWWYVHGLGVGWSGACQRHVHLTLMVRSWVGHVHVMYISRWWYVHGLGVGWSGACQRHVHLALMVRSWVGSGVEWGMSTSCTSYVDGTFVGWGGPWGLYIIFCICWCVFDEAPWKLWKRRSCSCSRENMWKQENQKKYADCQRSEFHDYIQIHCKYQQKIDTLSYTPRNAVKNDTSRFFQKENFRKSRIFFFSCGKMYNSKLRCAVNNISWHATCAGPKIYLRKIVINEWMQSMSKISISLWQNNDFWHVKPWFKKRWSAET